MLRRNKPLQRKTPLGAGKKGLGRKAAARPQIAKTQEDKTALAHQALWQVLKQRQTFPFQEYERLGNSVADFFCPAAKLAVAIEPEEGLAAWCAQQGYRYLTFSAEAVLSDPEGVTAAIAESFTLRLIAQ